MSTRRPVSRTDVFFWSLYARLYDRIWDSPITRVLSAVARRSIPEPGELVDLGCGTGLMTRGWAGRVTGVDASAPMLRWAVGSGRIACAVHRTVDATGLEPASADGVLLCNVLHLHPDPAGALREAVRVCRPDGVVFACWPLDGLDTTAIRRIERALGRSAVDAWIAHVLRGLIGTVAAISGTRRFPNEMVERAVFDAIGHDVVRDDVVAGCQRVVVLRPVVAELSPVVRPSPSAPHTDEETS